MADNEKQLSIEIKPEVASGQYSNLAIITHSPSEFIFDFASMLPGIAKPTVNSRIIMAPEHAKRLLVALQDNIGKYESTIGPINFAGQKPSFPIGGFGGNGNGAKS